MSGNTKDTGKQALAIWCAGAVTLSLTGLAAQAQQPTPQPAPQPPPAPQPQPPQDDAAAQINALQRERTEVMERLQKIAQEATEANPELREQEETLYALYREKLEEHGYPGEDEIEELQQIQNRLQTEADMDENERATLSRQLQEAVVKLQAAQQAAQQDEEVQQSEQALRQARSEAMEEVDPEAGQLENKLTEIDEKMQKLQAEMAEGMQGMRQTQ